MSANRASPEPGSPPAVALAHRSRARRSALFYLLIAAGALFVWAPLAVSPELHCVEYPCPIWLRAFIFGLGALFGGGALVAVLRGIEWGSRLDERTNEIVWWHGPPGAVEHRIPVARIRRIEVLGGDSVRMILRDAEDRRSTMPTDCAHPPEIGRCYPHIRIEISD
jgi:hypothetical protein